MPRTAPSPSHAPLVKTGPGGDFVQLTWAWGPRSRLRRRRDLALEDAHRHAIRIAEEAQALARRTAYLAGDAPVRVRPALRDLAARLEACGVELRLKTDVTHLNTGKGGAC